MTIVTREMITAAHGVTLESGDVVLSARLLERIYLAMEQAAPPPQTPFDTLSKDAERYQWLRRTQVELSLSNETIAGLVRSVGDLDAAIDAQKGTA